MSRPCLNCGERIDEGTFCSTACEDETLVSMGQAPTWARRAIDRLKPVMTRAEWVVEWDEYRTMVRSGRLILNLKPRLKFSRFEDCRRALTISGVSGVPTPDQIVECTCASCQRTGPMSFYLRVALDAVKNYVSVDG